MQQLSLYLERLQHLQKNIQADEIILLSHPSDVYYFTGIQVITLTEREAFVVVSRSTAQLFVAAFTPLPEFLEEVATSGPTQFHSTRFSVTHSLQILGIVSGIEQLVTTHNASTILFDEKSLFIAEANEIKSALSSATSTTLHYGGFDHNTIWNLRQQKDSMEITLLKKAGQIISQALEETLTSLQIGDTEKSVALWLENRMRELGAQGPAFPTIVAFGAHAALPHYQPGETPLEPETNVLIDCGANYNGYNSDITRTTWFGKHPAPEFLNIEKIVKDSYQVGKQLILDRWKSGTSLLISEIDKQVRDFIDHHGYGKFYIHTTGHGIGLEVHEPPSIYLTNTSKLLENMVVTIEPGIYLPGKLGYRYENTLLITSQGIEELTQ